MTVSDEREGSPVDDVSEVLVLWTRLLASNDTSLRERLIEHYLPFARMLAAKAYANRSERELEFLDFLQYASLGLVEAIDRFDPHYGVKFETFASQRIAGAILNGIASLSEKQEQIHARRRITSERLQSLKGAGLPAKDPDALFGYLAEIAIGLAVGFALEGTGMYEAEEAVCEDDAYQRIELKQLYCRVAHLLETLPANERRVVKFHYQQQLPFEEISRILQLTKGRVSQIHKSALKRLRDRLGSGIDLQC